MAAGQQLQVKWRATEGARAASTDTGAHRTPNCQTRFTVPLLRLRTAVRILHKPVLCKFVDVLAAAQVADRSPKKGHRRVQPETILLVLLVEPSALALALVSKGV